MRKVFTILGIVLMLAAVKPATTTYRQQISQYCSSDPPANLQTEQRARWIGEWWPHRSPDVGFIQCVGPAEYMTYHPYDVAAAMLVLGAGSLYFGLRSKHGKA